MMNELEAILGSDLVTRVFLYGSAFALIVSMIVATWLLERKRVAGVDERKSRALDIAPQRR